MLRRATFAVLMLGAATAWAAPSGTSALLGLVPADARAVVGVDVAALKDEPLVQQWLLEHQASWSRVDDDATRFLSEAGLDPARDVDAMLFAVCGSEDAPEPLALFAGRYDPATLGAALAARGGELVGVGSVTAYRVGGDKDGDKAALVRVTPSLVIVGSAATMNAVYGVHREPVEVVAAARAAGQLDLAAPFWMAATVPEKALGTTPAGGGESTEGRAMSTLAAAAGSVRQVAAWARVGTVLDVHAFATTTSEENAGLFRDAVRGALAAMRLAAQDREPQLVDVLRGVEVEADGSGVAVHARLPVDLLQQLSHEAHRHRHAEPAAESK